MGKATHERPLDRVRSVRRSFRGTARTLGIDVVVLTPEGTRWRDSPATFAGHAGPPSGRRALCRLEVVGGENPAGFSPRMNRPPVNREVLL